MTFKSIRKLSAGLLGLLLGVMPALAANKVEILAIPAPDLAAKKTVIQITFRVQDKTDNKWYAERVLDPSQGAAYEAASYTLTDAAGNPVPFTVEKNPGAARLQGSIRITPNDRLDSKTDYKLKILAGKLVFKITEGGVTTIEQNAAQDIVIAKEKIPPSDKRVESRSEVGETSIALLGGAPGGVATAQLKLDRGEFLGIDWLGIKLEGQADFTLSSDDKKEYLNSISGELSSYHVAHWFDRYNEVSIHGKAQADQSFDLVDSAVGLKYAIRPRDPLTGWLGRLFVRENDRANALLVLGYDYLQNVRGDAETVAARTGVDTEDGTHQASATLRLRIPLLREHDFSFLPALGGLYDVDLEADLKGVYDSSASKFLDQSRLTLAFTYVGGGELKPALMFSWVRGKEGPTYEQVSALLAGLRLSF